MLLNIKNLKQRRSNKKLSHKYAGPFSVRECVGAQAYRLWLREGTRIHDVFHVSLLEPYKARKGEPQEQLPLPELINDEEEWEVEAIMAKEVRKDANGAHEWYSVKWTGWPKEFKTWESRGNLANSRELVKEFEDTHSPPPLKRRRGRPRKEIGAL